MPCYWLNIICITNYHVHVDRGIIYEFHDISIRSINAKWLFGASNLDRWDEYVGIKAPKSSYLIRQILMMRMLVISAGISSRIKIRQMMKVYNFNHLIRFILFLWVISSNSKSSTLRIYSSNKYPLSDYTSIIEAFISQSFYQPTRW